MDGGNAPANLQDPILLLQFDINGKHFLNQTAQDIDQFGCKREKNMFDVFRHL